MPLRSAEAFAVRSAQAFALRSAKAFALRFVEICVLALSLSAVACGTRSETPDDRTPAASAEAPLPAVAGATGPRIVILGDSLTAGLGLPMAQAFPSRLQRHLDDEG